MLYSKVGEMSTLSTLGQEYPRMEMREVQKVFSSAIRGASLLHSNLIHLCQVNERIVSGEVMVESRKGIIDQSNEEIQEYLDTLRDQWKELRLSYDIFDPKQIIFSELLEHVTAMQNGFDHIDLTAPGVHHLSRLVWRGCLEIKRIYLALSYKKEFAETEIRNLI